MIIYQKKCNKIVKDENGKIYIDYHNGWSRQYPIYYGNKKFGYEFPKALPKYLKNKYENYMIKNEFK